ncbi:glutathione S-transferase family protein [Sporobolomyces koalae]|uniref:glutathione S-transferase family protein n=1 Tax=Sporobolomyces koalae TaxID=500713 RepID=UPI00316F1090
MSTPASTTRQPRATLYTFGGSVWASVPRLVALEKNYTEEELDEKTVDLGKGENFAPAFLKLSPSGHVPVLVVPYEHTLDDTIPTKFRALTGTKDICDFLDLSSTRSATHHAPALSPATVQRSADSKELIAHIHTEDAPDPNKLFLSFRTEQERDAKFNGMVGGFLKGRQEALERYAREVDGTDTRLKIFYEKKLLENGHLIAMYEGKADSASWQQAAQLMWGQVPKTLAMLEQKLEDTAPYLLGDQVSLADLHVGAWFARILATAGVTSVSDLPQALKQLESHFPGDEKVGAKTERWAENLFERKSFKHVYATGMH